VLTVSGTIPSDLAQRVASGRQPRADYVELAAALDADIVDYERAIAMAGPFGRVLSRVLGRDVTLALACFRERRHRETLFTDSERVGLLLACLLRFTRRRGRARHAMIAHRLSAPSKLWLHRLMGLRRAIDRVFVYATSQQDVAVDILGYAPGQVVLTPFMVDTAFWAPEAVDRSTARSRPMICAVGQELRDYVTLAKATRDVDVDVVIAAASPWSKRRDDTENLDPPTNVTVVRLDQFELRQLYADAAFTVVHVVDTDFQAGITAILESMAMGRAVICTRTTGQTDTIRDGETGRYVGPGDVAGLRAVIDSLLDDPRESDRIGAAGRRWAEEHADIEVYATRLATAIATLHTGRPLS
jgi:glycosyltransferase involved in cell wall biosynthesis